MQTFEEKNNRLQPTVSAMHMSINRRAKNNRKRTNINHSVYRTARTLNSMRPDGYEYRQVIPSRSGSSRPKRRATQNSRIRIGEMRAVLACGIATLL